MTNSALEALTATRAPIKAKLTRFKKFLQKIKDKSQDITTLAVKLEKFDPLYSEFDSVQTQIEILLGKNPQALEEQSQQRDDFENDYFIALSEARAILEENRPSSVPDNRHLLTSTPESTSQQSQASVVPPFDFSQFLSANPLGPNLPKITIPHFDGSFNDWVKFRDTFKSMVHDRARISKIEKFHYLSAALTGDAAHVIQSLGISEANYDLAWKSLTDRYEDSGSLIHFHTKALFELQVLSKSSYLALRQLIDNFNNHLLALKSLGEKTEHWDTMIMYLVATKLDFSTKREWEKHVLTDREKPTFQKMSNFLENHCKYLHRVTFDKPDSLNVYKKIPTKGGNAKLSERFTSHATTTKTCPLCNDSHGLYNCEKLRALPVSSRIEEVRRLRICYNCLSPGHHNRQCNAGPCTKCKKKHNTLLHLETSISEIANHQQNNEIDQNLVSQFDQPAKTSLVAHSRYTGNEHVMLGTALVWAKDRKGKLHECRVLLDSCSQVNLMTNEFCKKLELPTMNSDAVVSGVFKNEQEPQYRTQVTFKSRSTGYSKQIACLVTKEITDDMPNILLRRSEFNIPDGIIMADPQFTDTRPIDLLIGGGTFWQLLCVGQIQLREDQPILQKTQLGWIVAGSMQLPPPSYKPKAVCNLITNQQLHNEIQRFWEIEHHALHRDRPELDLRDVCEQHFLATFQRDPEGRFIVTIPFKNEVSALGDSVKMAEKRLLAMERKREKFPELNEKYIDFMKDYQEKEHMIQIPEDEICTNGPTNYLPHHAVFKEGSTTTKLRVVFDGSAKTSSGLSFNEVQRVGPVVQNDLFSIILRFRQYPIVLSADIAQMYRQIKVTTDQQDLQRILWRTDPAEPIRHFRLTTVTYGTASAPFLATRTLRQIGEENKEDYPTASQAIIQDFYVDDLLTGTNTVEEARQLKNELIQLLSAAGMDLRKWASNNPCVFDESNHSRSERMIQSDKDPKTLGLLWSPDVDQLKYLVKRTSHPIVTKRTILSTIAQIFDPLGLVGPAVIRAKILLQNLWQLKLDWDESLPQILHCMWMKFYGQLQALNKISVPRFVLGENPIIVQLHGFSDASTVAYGACLYLRSTDSLGNHSVHLLCAKSRVAPIRQINLPRLELQAALILAQLTETVSAALNVKIEEKYFWSDSTITLGWILSSPTRWPTFVANRTSEIQRLTNDNWNHVSSGDNPADLISRGIDPEDLRDYELWWKGPDWLSHSTDGWPSKHALTSEELDRLPEAKKCKTTLIITISPDFTLLERYSSIHRLTKVTAYCLRFMENLKKAKEFRKLGYLEVSERAHALTKLLRLAQTQDFPREIHDIQESKQVSSKSRLYSLNPFLDNHGLLRVGGRLVNAPIPFEQRHPIILSSNNPLTILLISTEHLKLMHGGCQAVMASLRNRYWPISCRNTIKNVLRKCVICFRARPLSTEYIMGNLPAARVTPKRAFYTCGVDYAGPFHIKGTIRSKVSLKAYMCIFVCFVTKAVHIELAHDLSTEAFLNCLRRFISRRGKCQHIYSDNGTNFVGASNRLNELSKLLQNREFQRNVTDCLAQDQISWHFIPPSAPHFGGLWESAVKSAKKHVIRVIGETRLTYEELYTILTQVEACLNSRPLTPNPNDPNDLNPLTPGHFLIGDSLTAVPHPDLRDTRDNRLNRYEHLQKMFQHFWQRWQTEYLTQLQQRNKWSQSKTNLLIPGAMVIVRDDNLPPMKWRLGRITELHPGRDNVTRVVTIRLADSTMRRPASKIYVLPIDQDVNASPE